MHITLMMLVDDTYLKANTDTLGSMNPPSLNGIVYSVNFYIKIGRQNQPMTFF